MMWNRHRLIFFVALVPALMASCRNGPVPPSSASHAQSLDLSGFDRHLVYENDFARPQKIAREEDLIEPAGMDGWRRTAPPPADAEWIAEGWGGAEFRQGKLRVAPSPFDEAGRPVRVETSARSHMVVWNRHVFPADLLLEFEMNPSGSTNGLTIVFFAAAGTNGVDLFNLSLPPRRAQYPAYHSGAIANYSDAYWSRNTAAESLSNRLRKNPGFELLTEGPSRTTGSTDKNHRVRILKAGAHIEVEVNGQVVCRQDDPATPHGTGRIGLRSMAGVTLVTYDNFKVWEVVLRPRGSAH